MPGVWLNRLIIWLPDFVRSKIHSFMFWAITKSIVAEPGGKQAYGNIVAALKDAPDVKSVDFTLPLSLNVDRDAVSDWGIVEMANHIDSMKKLSRLNLNCKTGRQEAGDILDRLLGDLLPHLKVRGDSPKLQDCVYFSMQKERGAYFPVIHWDSDWLQFPDADGFQLWYLLENEEPTGNMFMVETEELKPDDMPVRFLPTMEGGCIKTHHNLILPEFAIKTYNQFSDCKLQFKYLNMIPGDCMVMSKRTLHMSDPRPTLAGMTVNRLAVNVRVIIQSGGSDEKTIRFCGNHTVYNNTFPLCAKLANMSKKSRMINGQRHVLVSRTGMLNAFQ